LHAIHTEAVSLGHIARNAGGETEAEFLHELVKVILCHLYGDLLYALTIEREVNF